MREYKRKFSMPHYPTTVEVLESENGQKFGGILAEHDAFLITRMARGIVSDFLKEHGTDIGEMAGANKQECALNLFKVYKLFYGSSDNDLDILQDFMIALDSLKERLTSEAMKRTALIDRLKGAGANWPQIGALLISGLEGIEWDALEQVERDAAVQTLKIQHRNYKNFLSKSANSPNL